MTSIERFTAVERLDKMRPLRDAVRCKLCGNNAIAFDVVDFNKYCSQEDFYSFGLSGVSVVYNRCRVCGAIFTSFFDDWTPAAFADHVYNEDYIKVDSEYASIRPRFVANDMAQRWGDCRSARVLDYGSGAGAFADELRTLGYQSVEAYDPFSSPSRPSGSFDIVTCFEVIEHTPSPVETLRDICRYLKPDGCVIVSQTLQPENINLVRGNWWYIAPRNGHVCTFTADAMAVLAQSCGLTFHMGQGPYAFSRPERSVLATRALRTMGQPHYFAPLLAPDGERTIKGLVRTRWHKREVGDAGPFRWTGTAKLRWSLPSLPHFPATLRAVLPIFDRMTPAIENNVHGSLGQGDVSFRREGDNLVADFAVAGPVSSLTVTTPQPITPRALRGADDDRRLGLAVLGRPDEPDRAGMATF